MGLCVSTVKQWQHEAEQDPEVSQAPQPPAIKLPLPPLDAPSSYVAPPSPVEVVAHGGDGGGPKGMKRDPSHQFFFRKSQELSMAHLVRHPRLQPFAAPAAGGQFGMGDAYIPIKLLGRGGTGQTWLCREAASGQVYAVKLQQRPIPRHTVRLTYNEVTIQASTCVSSVHHSHVKEVMLTPSHLALVLDYEAGGSAAEFVAQQIPRVSRMELVVSEEYARFMFRQLVAGLQHLHENHVAHRDVKLDNTLLDGQSPPTVLLCDFQFAKYWGAPQLTRMKTHLGTAVYMAPELIENRQSHASYNPVEVDVWAAGIWLVALLCGAFPFDNRPGADDTAAEMQILHQERSGSWTDSKFVRPYVPLLSSECVDLLNHTLHPDPDLRFDLDDVAAHPWMRKPLPPVLDQAWERTRRAQLQLERRLSLLKPEDDLVHQRNSRVFDLVREAAVPPEHWEHSYQRLLQVCGASRLVDCGSVPGAVRIDMRPEVVARRLSDKALSLLDGPLPEQAEAEALPGGGARPKRFSLPLQTIGSHTSLAGLVPGGGEAAPLAPPAPSPLGPRRTKGRAGAAADTEGSLGAASSATDAEEEHRLRQLSPFADTQPSSSSGVPAG